jgi:hypothetical protein
MYLWIDQSVEFTRSAFEEGKLLRGRSTSKVAKSGSELGAFATCLHTRKYY